MAHNRKISFFLVNRRYRRSLKSKVKQKAKRQQGQIEDGNNSELRKIGKQTHSLGEALDNFLPKNLKYLISHPDSPFFVGRLPCVEFKDYCRVLIPENFSIIDNTSESIKTLQEICAYLIQQKCKEFRLDYSRCRMCDLPTQVTLDSILIDYDRFVNKLTRAKIINKKRIGFNIESIGGNDINDTKLQNMINSVGSPVELIHRQLNIQGIIPYKLRFFDGKNCTAQELVAQKEIDTTTLIAYVENCLNRLNRQLSRDAQRDLGVVAGEIIINAEEHSSLSSRYLVGYFEEIEKENGHYGILNLVIMNYGMTIYEKFKNPNTELPYNKRCIEQMKQLSERYVKRNFFKKQEFTEESLWTLFSLQGGVSYIPRYQQKRGNGTIQFLESFFKLKGDSNVDNVSKMILLSGNTRIDFDGSYHVTYKTDTNDGKIGMITFNDTGSLYDKPNPQYVKHVDSYFPGTLIFARLLINEDDLKTNNNYE